MYLVNSEFLDVSAANYRPKDGDVIRFAFSLAGWGMDLGANYSGDPADSWVEPANRDRLMTLVSDIDAREDREYLMQQPAFVHAWEAAVCLLTDMEVHQPDMDRAEGVLRHAMEDASQQRIDFDDLRGHWAEKAVDRAVQQQIMVGTGNRLFEPDRSITRAEFAAVLCRVLGLEQMTEQDFTDVGGEWYCGYVGSVAHYGIMCGKGNDVFEPFAPITREQAAVALQAAARLVGKATVTTPESVESILGSYSDAGLCSLWSREAVAFCSAVGLMTDYNGRFEPLKPVSRAQAAQIAVRMIDVLEN